MPKHEPLLGELERIEKAITEEKRRIEKAQRSEENRWKKSAKEFFALSPRSQERYYKKLRLTISTLTYVIYDLKLDRARTKERFKLSCEYEAVGLVDKLQVVQAVEKRKIVYMKEANSMRVERQVILLKLQTIYEDVNIGPGTTIAPQEWQLIDCKFQELIGMLRKDPERL